jgi:hypothetical protein
MALFSRHVPRNRPRPTVRRLWAWLALSVAGAVGACAHAGRAGVGQAAGEAPVSSRVDLGAYLSAFHEGIHAYEAHRFGEAIASFERALAIAPGKPATDFVIAQDQGMDGVQGLRVDTKRKLLWAATHADATELTPLAGPPRYAYPNGIAVDDAHHVLFVADMADVHRIDLARGQSRPLAFPAGYSLAGFDGLYFERGRLVGVTGVGRGRIVAFELNDARDAVLGRRVIEAGHPDYDQPTTAAIVGGAIYVLANSQTGPRQGEKATAVQRVEF